MNHVTTPIDGKNIFEFGMKCQNCGLIFGAGSKWADVDSECVPASKTLRDEMAVAALPLAYDFWKEIQPGGYNPLSIGGNNLIAESAYAIADAMLKARERK